MNPFISFAAVLMLAVSSTHAVMIAPFPGLPKLIDEADAIAIIAIEEQIPAGATIGWTSYRCFVHQTLKGDLTEGQRVNLTLFDIRSSFVSPFATHSTHIAFLSTKGNGGESLIRNLQYEGSILRLSPFGHEREPDGWNLERKIKILLERSIAYWDREQQREKELLLAAITGLSSPLRRELEQAHRSVRDSTQREKSIRISPNVDFDGITANAIVSYQPDGKEWTIQINLLAEDWADIEKESPPKLKVFNPAGAPLKVVGDNGYSDIGHLFVMYWVTAKSVEEIAEAELEFKGLKRRVIFRPNGSEVPTGDNQVEFRGSVGAGEKFEHRFAEKYRFVLDPTEFGWTIRIFEEGRDEDLSRLTPPLHFVPNPREIEGWHFRNKLNTGPNSEKLADEGVNAPQHERQFIFSPEVGRTIQGPDANSSPTSSEIDRIRSFGQGVLTITDLKLSPPKRGERAKITKMNYRCVISLSTSNAVPQPRSYP